MAQGHLSFRLWKATKLVVVGCGTLTCLHSTFEWVCVFRQKWQQGKIPVLLPPRPMTYFLEFLSKQFHMYVISALSEDKYFYRALLKANYVLRTILSVENRVVVEDFKNPCFLQLWKLRLKAICPTSPEHLAQLPSMYNNICHPKLFLNRTDFSVKTDFKWSCTVYDTSLPNPA